MASLLLPKHRFKKKKQKNIDEHDGIAKLPSCLRMCHIYLRLGKKPASIPEIYNLVWPFQTAAFF